jgi:predicted amidohydrolase
MPEKAMSFKLAMIQMLVEPGNLEANLLRASDRIRQAKEHDADLVVLPEMMDLGWTHPSAKTLAYKIPNGRTCQALCKMARDHQIYLCAGLAEKAGAKIYNAAVVISPRGEVILKHRKLNELEIAHDIYHQGDRLNVIDTELGILGLYICADGLATQNALSLALGYLGAEIILTPCAWAVPPGFDQNRTPYGDLWREVYQPVSQQFDLWIVAVSNVGMIETGPWQGWNCVGCSLAYAPGGREVLQAPFGAGADTIAYIDVAL